MASRKAVLGGLLLALGASGCVVDVTFEPFGNEVTLAGSWTVNGAAPTPASCGALGIDKVRIAFLDGADVFTTPALTFDCEAGSFDTRPVGVLNQDSYTTRWDALNAAGTVIGSVNTGPLDVSLVTHANLAPVNFTGSMMTFDPRGTDAELTADWTLNGMTPNATLCTESGIANFAVILYDEMDTAYANGVEIGRAPCMAGKYDSMPAKVIKYGRYLTGVRALDASGATLGEYRSSAGTFVVASPITRAMLMTAPFTYELETTLTVMFRYELSSMSGDGTCTMAGVSTAFYELRDSTGTPIAGGRQPATGNGPCANEVTWGEEFFGTPGTFRLYYEGYDAGGTKHWAQMSTPCEVTVVENMSNVANCFADYI